MVEKDKVKDKDIQKKEKKEKKEEEKREKKLQRAKEKQAKKESKLLAKKERKDKKGGDKEQETDDEDYDSGTGGGEDESDKVVSLSGSLTMSPGQPGKTISLESSRSIYTSGQNSNQNQQSHYDSEMFTSESFLIALSDTDHLGPAIKSVFESNKQQEVITSLNNYIDQKDKDIEKICGDNHEGFINSVTNFLSLKGENLDLKQSIINLNYQLQESGSKFVNKADELFSCKRTKDNINKTKEIINNCQYAILLGMKIEEYINTKRYYLAIKNMDQLHNVYLKRLNDFQFARNMDANIPMLKEKIKKLVKDEFNTWMVEIKEKSAKIGRFGMIQSSKKLEKERNINPLKLKTTFGENEATWDKILNIPVDENQSIIGYLSKSPHTSQQNSPSFVNKNELLSDELVSISPFDEENINFHPLYQCLFIYSSLGLLEEFQAYYTLNRLLQFQMVIQPKESGQNWEIFLQQIAGYFMVESKVMDSTQPHLSKTTINECWNTALVKITSLLQELVTHCHDTPSLSSFKTFVLVFTNTLSYYSYHVQPLVHLLETMKEKYCQFAIKQCVDLFTHILENESTVNLYIEDMQDYENLIVSNQLDKVKDESGEQQQQQQQNNQNNDKDQNIVLPKSFPFSKLVPQFYTLIKKFISEFYDFADQLTENENFIIRSTDTLIKKINEVLHSHLQNSQAVPQVIQLVINLDHLLDACNFFKDYLNSLILGESSGNTGSSSNTSSGNLNGSGTQSNKVILSSSNQLYTTKKIGEKTIIKLCERNIEDLMSSSANINWFPLASDDRARDYIDDVITFLEVTLTFVNPLTPTLREEFITKSFKKISETLTNILFSDQIKKFNMAAVKCFNADLKRIEEFVKVKASEKERTTTSSRNLLGYFYEIRQTVNLLLSENPEEFADPKIRSKHYNLITNINQIMVLFNKYKEESKGFSQPKEQKDRNNKISAALKKFKEIQL